MNDESLKMNKNMDDKMQVDCNLNAKCFKRPLLSKKYYSLYYVKKYNQTIKKSKYFIIYNFLVR